MMAFLIGLYTGNLFKERYGEHLKDIVSQDKELSLFGIGLFLLFIMNNPKDSKYRFIPAFLKTLSLSLQRRIYYDYTSDAPYLAKYLNIELCLTL
ncbi:MAG: hypothetical protein HQL06_03120 [Nitrospirae bacterium]|nr:hypothetical protein [Nitrospirota bacterium]